MWIIPSLISSRFAAESECLTKDLPLPSSTSESEPVLWVTLSGKATPRPRSWPGWKIRHWSPLLFGAAIWEPSRQKSFTGWWTLLWQESHANRSVLPASKSARKTKDGSGRSCGTLRAAPGRGGVGLKTSEGLFTLDWNPSLMTLPKAGGLRNGCICERERWVPVTSGSGFSCSGWMSPRGHEVGEYQNQANGTVLQTPAVDSFRCRGGDRKEEMGLDQQARTFWSTPTADVTGGDNNPDVEHARGVKLITQANQWATPTSSENSNRTTKRAPSHHAGTHGEVLAGQAADWGNPLPLESAWPTPAARDAKGANGEQHMATKERPHEDQLANAAVYRFSHPVLNQESGQPLSPTTRTLRRRLNPAFVCWLMGWPMWWTRAVPTSCGAQETALWRSKLRWHLRSCLGESD